jgi:hypothetical protein
MRLSKRDKELFDDCRGHCSVCFYDGGCSLQIKMAKKKANEKAKKSKEKK